MYKTSLTEAEIVAGRILVKALDATGLPIAFAGWLKLDESPYWQLHIATPDVQTHGPTTVIRLLQGILAAMDKPLGTDDVAIANTTNSFVTKIDARDYDIDKDGDQLPGIQGARVFGYFDGKSIEDSFVYRIDRRVRASEKPVKMTKQVMDKARRLAA